MNKNQKVFIVSAIVGMAFSAAFVYGSYALMGWLLGQWGVAAMFAYWAGSQFIGLRKRFDRFKSAWLIVSVDSWCKE